MMNGDDGKINRISPLISRILFDNILSKKSSLLLIILGGMITIQITTSTESLFAAGAVQYSLASVGVFSILWGTSELIPSKVRWATAALRIFSLIPLGVIILSATFLIIFWRGMG